MALKNSTAVRTAMATAVARERIVHLARNFKVVKRKRVVDVYAVVWTLILGFQGGRERSIAGLRRVYGKLTGDFLVASSFYKRLSPAMAKLMQQLAREALATMDVGMRLFYATLAGFDDPLAIDATVLRLHDLLAGAFLESRSNHSPAGAKLHMVMSVVDGSAQEVKLTSERTSDTKPWKRVGKWVRNRLLLFDLGYYEFHLFDRIDASGGFFVSRAKSNANFRITALNRSHRGQSVGVVGRTLKEVLPRLQRGLLDVMAEVSFKRRIYNGRRKQVTRTFRLVAVRNNSCTLPHRAKAAAAHRWVATTQPACVWLQEPQSRT